MIPGFPLRVNPSSEDVPPIVTDLDGDGDIELVVVQKGGLINPRAKI